MSERAKRIAIDWVTEHERLLTGVHDKIWRWAEVGLQEVKTARLLTEILERHGFKVERGVAGMPSAFVATYGSGKPVIGIMGELDALPGLSQKAVPWREPIVEGGPGHGCGHHGYATAALGGALAAKAAMEEENLPGTIKCFGCPAEETLVGKVFMVRDGVFDGVDACLGHHPGSMNTARLGSGNAMNSVKFEFFGVAAHAAGSPHRGRSALDAVELMNIGVNYLREHIVQEARIHYVIEDGGHEPNVVPAYARSWYYIRAPTYNEEELEFARELAKSIPRKQKMAMLRRLSELIPDAMELMDVDLNDRIYDPFGEGRKGGGSSDVADVAWNTPTQQFSTTMFIVGSPGHSWQNVASGGTSIGHKSSIFASKVMAATVIDLLTKPEVLRKAKEEWKRRMKGLTYKSPLPPDLKPPLDQLPPMPSEE